MIEDRARPPSGAIGAARRSTDQSLLDLLQENVTLKNQLAGADHTTIGSNAGLFVYAVVGLAILGVVSILTIFVVRPDRDNTALIAVILAFLLPTSTALLGAAVHQVGKAVNSRLSQLVRLTAQASRAEGRLDAAKDAKEAQGPA